MNSVLRKDCAWCDGVARPTYASDASGRFRLVGYKNFLGMLESVSSMSLM